MKVRPLLKPEFTPSGLDLGSLYHQILESFCSNFRERCLRAEDAAESERGLEDCFQNYYREWREAAANDLVQLMLLLQENQIRHNLWRWFNSELQWAAETGGRFHLKYLELAFGLTKGDYDPASLSNPYQLGEGPAAVKLWGKIDRVDVDDRGRFIVYDYKSGRGPAIREIIKTDYLQLPVYIMALEQLLFGARTAAGGSYLGLKSPSRNRSRLRSGLWCLSNMAAMAEMAHLPGLLDEREWQNWLNEVQITISAIVRAVRQGEFQSVGRECLPFCEYQDVCRRGEWEVDRTDGLSV